MLASFLGWLWCGTRLFVKAASGRQRYNVLGAFNAVSHELVRVTNTGYITAETVCELLGKIAALNLAVPITLVLDNAGLDPGVEPAICRVAAAITTRTTFR